MKPLCLNPVFALACNISLQLTCHSFISTITALFHRFCHLICPNCCLFCFCTIEINKGSVISTPTSIAPLTERLSRLISPLTQAHPLIPVASKEEEVIQSFFQINEHLGSLLVFQCTRDTCHLPQGCRHAL